MLKNCVLFLLTCCSVFTARAQISNDSLVLFLPFNGNANDISGNNYNGIVQGATLAAGFNNLPNSAYYFNGNSSIIIPGVARLDGPITAFTILMRLKPQIDSAGNALTYSFFFLAKKQPGLGQGIFGRQTENGLGTAKQRHLAGG